MNHNILRISNRSGPVFRFGILLISNFISLTFVFGLVNVLNGLPVVYATTITVTTFTDELNSDGDCSLREAVQAANTDTPVDGCLAGNGADSISIPSGIYSLTLAGAFENANASGDLDITGTLTLNGADMATTIINANGLDRAIDASITVVTVTLSNLTISNGLIAASAGGGLSVSGEAMLSKVTLISNSAGADGGGAWFSSTTTIVDTTFINNQSGDEGGGAYFASSAYITGTTFSNNEAQRGGGADFESAASISAGIFTSNTAASSAGGGANFEGIATISHTTFANNVGIFCGGGAWFDNHASITDTLFISNTSPNCGGGAHFHNTASVTGVTFVSNTATSGGGAYFQSTANVTNSTFLSNTAQFGGGVYFLGAGTATGDFVNSLFATNQATINRGYALYAANIGSGSSLTLRHLTIADSTMGIGSAVYMYSGTLNITNTIITSATVGFERTNGTLNENYNLFDAVATPYSGTVVSGGNSISGTAAFANPALFKLTAASMARDAGTDGGVTADFEGDLRPQGLGFDIGWDELAYILPVAFTLYLPSIFRSQ